ncbi:hypothetical protein [Calothrix sp. 336/3]|uniref:hypothetical protein n=1 Tax=Calothrix sp. 336/3 TaxID=1337936 RepID=UPI000624B3B1|nr:hypothetical protein [Calothrix sp. 336/3]AKG21653.1 hypothetical protein IJ00_10595 [Calothrix sp. 336/3]
MSYSRKTYTSTRRGWLQSNQPPQANIPQNTPQTRQGKPNNPQKARNTTVPTANAVRRASPKADISISSSKVGMKISAPRRNQNPSISSTQGTGILEPGNQRLSAIPIMPSSSSLPMWLLRIVRLQRYSSVVTFLLVVASLFVYGWTVYSQQIWGEEYRKLQNLQRYQRQLTTNNEMLKNQMAQEAQKSSTGLVSPTPSGTIFLRPAPANSNPVPTNTTVNPVVQPQPPINY